jgi:lipopolysaccharide/colanic/teichoic acid biosynthesis glycosyltransferase
MTPATMSVSRPAASRLPWLERIKPERALFRGRAYRLVKRLMDLTVSMLALPVLAPLMLACALAIKLESPRDPIWFYQVRTGKGGKPFRMLKFRTMVVNAEEMKKQLMHLNELQWPDFKIANDPRITHVGKFLRKTSLDELPQIINIFTGEMSLVGPRPTSFSAQTYTLWHTERLDVTPGLTGLWQIIGRGSTEFDERLRLDIAYIEHRCLWLDIQIMFRTLGAIIRQEGN